MRQLILDTTEIHLECVQAYQRMGQRTEEQEALVPGKPGELLRPLEALCKSLRDQAGALVLGQFPRTQQSRTEERLDSTCCYEFLRTGKLRIHRLCQPTRQDCLCGRRGVGERRVVHESAEETEFDVHGCVPDWEVGECVYLAYGLDGSEGVGA